MTEGHKASYGSAPMSEEVLRRITLGEPTRLNGAVVLADYCEQWPILFEREAQRIRKALATRAVVIEHVGSTAVPGLAAKPIIDVDLAVVDSSDEPAYVTALEAAGYALRIREPAWHQHRLLTGTDPPVNLHVFSAGCDEIERNLLFRDRLRTSDEDRELYARAKRRLAAQRWDYVQSYADAKTEVIEEIIARARAATRTKPSD